MLRVLACGLLALILLLAPSGPIAAQDVEDGPVAGQDDRGVVQDAALWQQIQTLLNELEGYGDVQVTVRSGVVILQGEVVDPAAAQRIEDLVTPIEGVTAVENRITTSTDLDKRLNPAAERLGARLSQALNYLPLVLVAVLAALAVSALGFFLARRIRFWQRIAPNAFIADIYRQLLRLAFILAGIVLALDILGATALLGTILGAAGLVGLAIGFAVRDTVENFIASIMLSMRQPFRPNDAVMIEGHEGRVIRLTSRATILLDFDGNHVRIPNATVFKGRIVNYSSNPERRFLFRLGVEPDCDLAAVRKLMDDTLRALPFILDTPAVDVWIDDITEGGVIFTLTGWIDQRDTALLRARGEALRAVKDAVEAAGAAIPDTTYRIRLEDSGAPKAAPPVSAPAPAATPPATVDVREEHDLSNLIDAERAGPKGEDLLSDTAETE
ncbi:mechanosensitive ion channel [Maribius pontilimi]|uniref:Small-conductance mechanosensitive channel n=1 Tax=Palleronia pontilimi TaxID=1964209 RepID=A0A934IBB2_9RHOB|nr:mechanosensitive ion channel family protein [Palleronia pontilimi]MBJ3762486.1 mechanosensitive ion channel [Palleronia pontilimi]